MNALIVRPLVERLYDPKDCSVGRSISFLFSAEICIWAQMFFFSLFSLSLFCRVFLVVFAATSRRVSV